MGIIKKRSIAALKATCNEIDAKQNGASKADLNSLKTLTEVFLNTSDKKQRKKLADDFKARHLELAEFLKANPDLVNAEVEKSLLLAAVGGEYEETETVISSNGKRRIKKTKKQLQPNVAAASKWLNNKNPEEWSDKPQAEPEMEDTSEIDEVLYGEKED